MIAAPALEKPFVAGAAGILSAALVAAPSRGIAGVEPIQGESHAIADRAHDQHLVFAGRLNSLGVRCIELKQLELFDGAVTIADSAVVVRDGAILMRPSNPSRRGELAAVEAALEAAGVPIVGRIEAPGLLDGGDVLYGGDALYVAVPKDDRSLIGIPPGVRGNAAGRGQLARIAQTIGLRVVDVGISAQIRRLGSVASFIGPNTILVAPSVVDCVPLQAFERIEVERGEERGAGVLALGNRRVIANLRFRTVLPGLQRAGYTVDALDLWDFGRLGITPSLLALALKRS
ncbi:MAG: hypothetical protein ACREM6_11240 [Vulcanimicrobiaceae bacterium]